MRKTHQLLGVAVTTLFVLGLGMPTAYAVRKNPLEGQPAIRHRLEMRRLRFEITPQFTSSINQDYKTALGVGAKLEFHILDWIGVGFEGSYTGNVNTSQENEIRSKLPTGAYTYNVSGPTPTLAIHDEHVLGINGIMSLFVSVTPFSGKFALFSSAFANYDLYVTGGLGFVNYTNTCCHEGTVTPTGSQIPDPNLPTQLSAGGPVYSGAQYAGFKTGGAFSVGTHLYFTEWMGLNLEVRDYIVKANPSGLDYNGDRILTGTDERIQNNFFVHVGLTFLLPPHAKITK